MGGPESVKRECKRILLSFIHRVEEKISAGRVEALLKNYDNDIVENTKPAEIKSVLFVITRMVRFHGGQTSILRLGTELAKAGYRVGYAVYKKQSKEEMHICASSNLADFKGTLHDMTELAYMTECSDGQADKTITQYDAVVATSWDTVFFAKRLPGYKMYFVQDFEPYFYKFGELFMMASKTYEQGLHMVSLGNWNKMMIEKHCLPVSELECVDFPYSAVEYPFEKRNFEEYTHKKVLTLAVYLKYYGKRLPTLIQYMLVKLKEEFASEGMELKIKYFGEAKSYKPKGGENLGMLTKQELLSLYREADFGLAFSYSNISLVTLEMMSSGLPVIELKEGSFTEYFSEECALLVSPSYKELYEKLKTCVKEPSILEKRQQAVERELAPLSWEETGKQFAGILARISNKN